MIFLGIGAGIFTAEGRTAIAVVDALLVTLLVCRALRGRGLLDAEAGATRRTGIILLMTAAASVFGWLLVYLQVPTATLAALQRITSDRFAVLALIVLLMLGLAALGLQLLLALIPALSLWLPGALRRTAPL